MAAAMLRANPLLGAGGAAAFDVGGAQGMAFPPLPMLQSQYSQQLQGLSQQGSSQIPQQSQSPPPQQVNQNAQMEWEIDSFSKKYLKEITNAAEDSDKIILATDPDREGEAIAWHVKKVLESKKLLKGKDLERVVFNEITKKAILEAIKNPREIHLPLVEAYLARRALDYLVGFTGVWCGNKKIASIN